MAKVVRGLLTLGNKKVGESIHIWSIPALITCPGRSAACSHACYATKHRYQFDAVRERLEWNHQQSLSSTDADSVTVRGEVA